MTFNPCCHGKWHTCVLPSVAAGIFHSLSAPGGMLARVTAIWQQQVLIGMVVLSACEPAFAAPPTHVCCMPAPPVSLLDVWWVPLAAFSPLVWTWCIPGRCLRHAQTSPAGGACLPDNSANCCTALTCSRGTPKNSRRPAWGALLRHLG